MKFIFVRHGESEANARLIIADAHPPLTEQGLEQARKTGQELKGKGITQIVCSPMLRAQQTAETIAGELGIELAHIQVMDELRERGLVTLENKPRTHESEWYYTVDSGNGIETRDELTRRMQSALKKIEQLSGEGMLLVVGHACSGFYLLQVAKGNLQPEDMEAPSHMSNADFIEVEL